jgi:large subunit ribosomal protein L15
MNLDDILSSVGKHKARRRIGRGNGSGYGKTSGRGHRGYGQRSGSNSQLGFEGGQNPILARIPKRGFSNFHFRKEYQIVNVSSLEQFDAGSRVDATMLAEARLIADPAKLVKVLGNGELTRKLTVVANKFSSSAAEKIAKAGGSVEEV